MGLVNAADGIIPVEYGQFWVIAGSSDDPGPQYSGTDEFLEVSGSGLLCLSAAGVHEANLRIEHWDTTPDEDSREWEAERTVPIIRGRGPACGLGLSGGPTVAELPLDIPVGQAMTARVRCRGRAQLRAWFDAGNAANPATGTEEWLVQLWTGV